MSASRITSLKGRHRTKTQRYCSKILRRIGFLGVAVAVTWIILAWRLRGAAIVVGHLNPLANNNDHTIDKEATTNGAQHQWKDTTPFDNTAQQRAHLLVPNVQSPRDAIKETRGLEAADAYFNTIPVTLRTHKPPPSAVSCVGIADGNNGDDGWMYRSCEYETLCFDVQRQEYVLVDDVVAKKTTAGQKNLPVAIGGINPRWHGQGDGRGIEKVKWNPTVRSASEYDSYFQLPTNVLLVPFHSMAGHNVGHLVWDDLYALYKILRLYGYIDGNIVGKDYNKPMRQFLFIRHKQSTNGTLYATCDIRRSKRLGCKENFAKFLPVMGVDPATFSTSTTVNLTMNTDHTLATTATLVCANQGVAGIGLLTDHGFYDHGWEVDPRQASKTNPNDGELMVPHNLGQGRLFFDFRNFMLDNYYRMHHRSGESASDTVQWPPQITFSVRSSKDWARRLNFTSQMQALASVLPQHDQVILKEYEMRKLSLLEQMRVARRTTIYVAACGGGSVTATFLPRGATLIVFYDARGGFDFETMQPNGRPARLDWDLLNNAAAHLHVHWLPVNTMDEPVSLELFVLLIQHELAILQRAYNEER